MKHRARSALLVLLAVLALTLRAQSEEPSVDLSAPLPLDPAIATHGTLANGLAYWVLPHAMPKGRVSLVLRLDSGSLQEEENQRGLAHFLEHMAFNGSKHFPPGEVVQYFESIGMRFGRDQNAFTAFDQTAYMLNLPDTRPATLEKGLLFLSDVGQGLALTPEEVEKERGVILEEARARGGVRMRMMEKTLPLLLPDARLARRIPIGDPEVVRTAPAERLRAYYRTWYRP
ncbi:MAG: M16 family metallopeptidase, partial [Planctomycetota bacterium]